MLTSIDFKFIFSGRLGLFSSANILQIANSGCRPLSCLLDVLALFLAIFLPSSYS